MIKSFGDYRRRLADRLSKEFEYDFVPLTGQLRDIGSCWDGSKVGAVNEMDSLYVMHGDRFVIQESKKKRGSYHVYLKIDSTLSELEPRRIRDEFADNYSKLVAKLELPECLQHGGYKACHPNHSSIRSAMESKSATRDATRRHHLQSSSYNGVRYNGPAATSQFLSKDKTLLTWDMTPVVVLPDSEVLREAVRKAIQPIIAENPDKMFPPSDIHLIPDVTENTWRLSTAQMEADILRVLSSEAPMKKALSFCKVLTSRLKKWNGQKGAALACAVNILRELDAHLEKDETDKTVSETRLLNRKMRFGHIWIPADRKDAYCEDMKSNISINNAAVKHILIASGCRKKGAFAPSSNTELVRQLVRDVFEILGNEEVYSSYHALLPGIKISHFSVAPNMAAAKHIMARDVCRQCKTLLEESMTEVM